MVNKKTKSHSFIPQLFIEHLTVSLELGKEEWTKKPQPVSCAGRAYSLVAGGWLKISKQVKKRMSDNDMYYGEKATGRQWSFLGKPHLSWDEGEEKEPVNMTEGWDERGRRGHILGLE